MPATGQNRGSRAKSPPAPASKPGSEALPAGGSAEDSLLMEAEALAEEAMRED